MTRHRRSLPLINQQGPMDRGHTGRSAMTCLYKCGNACDHPVPNQSDNEYFGDVVQTALAADRAPRAEVSRRDVVRAGAFGALVLGFGSSLTSAVPAAADPADGASDSATGGAVDLSTVKAPVTLGALTHEPVPPNRLDSLVVPNGYGHAVVIRWGDPVLPGAPAFDIHNQSAAAQSKQFGYNNDYVAVLPLGGHRGNDRALLVVNHEYTNEELIFPGYTGPDSLSVEQIRTAMAAHGLSIVEIQRVGRTGQWSLVCDGSRPYNRRITVLSTTFQLTGPAAGSALLTTVADPAGRTVTGTLSNCSGGVTPWGTVLSGEENFNRYFVGGDAAPAAAQPGLLR